MIFTKGKCGTGHNHYSPHVPTMMGDFLSWRRCCRFAVRAGGMAIPNMAAGLAQVGKVARNFGGEPAHNPV